ncbi:MAG: protease PrsW [Candidatus Thermoplasmatota archaeon]|nr:protease PrsW [Candidatus Thermoplasmatota archaeon]
MDILPHASLFLGVIPALLLLFISLKGFEGFFKEKTMFIFFIAGIVTGFISAVIEILTSNVGIYYLFLFPILEQVFKTMILNIGRFQGKRETTIYGLTLGLGFGSIFTPVSILFSNVQTTDYLLFGLVLFGAIGIILFQGATGAIIGYGIYDGKLSKYLLFVILLHLPVTIVIFVTNFYRVGYLQISLVAYGLFLYWYATKKIMPRILLQSQRRKRSKKEIDIKTN